MSDILFDSATVGTRTSVAIHNVHDFEVALRTLLDGADITTLRTKEVARPVVER